MTNLEKMNELVGSNVDKEKIINWAYTNRIFVSDLPYEDKFQCMEKSVEAFYNNEKYADVFGDGRDEWGVFLDLEYVE